MARIARAVAPGIPHCITQQGNRRHGSGNEYGIRRIQGVKLEIVSGTFFAFFGQVVSGPTGPQS
jgi:hypothetical protein